ncbi:beta-N-acetylhexosaminidase [Acidaminobacter sp. JC074]|uniref:beta-N-acetylhexosaminidase n=1 Tax=Acidaminobacter sp. JC074 TaxID=2530199 RepID=UPI001F0D7E9C|nr:beta-N-acetylhexosaminidase [Acidaminobacter sp. JC074]
MNLSELSLREKIGQMFIVGVMDDKHLQKVLLDYHVGGIIHFSRNGQTAKEAFDFFSRARALSKHPLIRTIDQEGGIVTRIKEGITPISGNMAIAATGDTKNAEIASHILSKELTAIGANMNLAPVVDVNNNAKNPVIGVRSFGENPDRVADFSSAALKGYKENNMLAVAKHFPGHGDTSTDSHFNLPRVDHDLERLHQVELKPFKRMIDENIDGIMISHVMFKAIDDKRPATLSKRVITDLLRDELDYQGLIMTDCMEMHAVSKFVDPKMAAVEAILSGVDMVMYSSDLDVQVACMEAVYEAVKSGLISEEIIDKAVKRIIRHKSYMSQVDMSWDEARKLIMTEEAMGATVKIALSSITQKGRLPFDLSECQNYYIPDSDLLKETFEDAKSYDMINKDKALVFYRNKADLESYIDKLDPGKVVLVNLKSPYEVFGGFTTLFTYELSRLSLTGLQAVLEGDAALGKLPVSEVI